eukprot:CAMPEP_0201489292 /NCGR_PEP_ID=MMETSP0151_2-20130828/21880_1 /ASSEMBLY_ACC=CAM_ASM_000257 /TAXON_ID=200890 /ORGANISM="Paramoeba atlantica, Strain 621/1 / CCAP 1560/9" /LENGTH=201 /DNA_ID=CAMNT_0047874835 /DNA_START=45 /DNA_END=650 /DNA_ORIENTATION=+
MSSEKKAPELLKASNLKEGEIGDLAWIGKQNGFVSVSEGGSIAEAVLPPDDKYFPSFVPVRSNGKLHSGEFTVEFEVERIEKGQIGVGAMLLWDIGEDWGFFGYLGASSTAWSYDPSTGDVVTSTRSIESGLETFKDNGGVITMFLSLPREEKGSLSFELNGKRSKEVELPAGSVVMPAACFLVRNQKVRIGLQHNCKPAK